MKRLAAAALAGLALLVPAGSAHAANTPAASVFADMFASMDRGTQTESPTARVFTACSDLPITWAVYVAPGSPAVKTATVQASVKRALDQISTATAGRYVFQQVDGVSAHRYEYGPNDVQTPQTALAGSPIIPSSYVDMLLVVAPTGVWVNGGALTTRARGWMTTGGIENKVTLEGAVVPVRKGTLGEISAQAWKKLSTTKRDGMTMAVVQWLLGREVEGLPEEATLSTSARTAMSGLADTSCQLRAAHPELSSQSTLMMPGPA